MTELYTAVQWVLFPFAALASIIGAASVLRMLSEVISGNALRVARFFLEVAAYTGAIWAYLMIPGGLG